MARVTLFRVPLPFVAAALLVGVASLFPPDSLVAQAGSSAYDPALFDELEYRMVGPFRGGRVTAVTGIADDPHTYYMGSTGGGVWKTDDGGNTGDNVSDGFFEAGSMGALDVANSDPNVIYAGTGSACTRGNVSTGIGVYKSSDAGATWSFLGLPEAGQIGAVEVHPDDPDLVYVAALGQIFGKNAERGVYRSEDGGGTWERVLFASDSVGAVDLSMNPRNPRIIYAALWRAERKPWTMISGCGPDCGNGEDEHDPEVLWAGTNDGLIHVSRDGGESWTDATPDGIPAWSTVNVIEPSPHAAGRAFAAVYRYRMNDWAPYVFRTDDFGESWVRIADGSNGIPADHPVRAIREDPDRRGLLYAGTEFGLFVSFDDGEQWQSLQLDLPHTAVTDLEVHRQDLVVATQGRSFWVLDDVTPLHELTDEVASAAMHLF